VACGTALPLRYRFLSGWNINDCGDYAGEMRLAATKVLQVSSRPEPQSRCSLIATQCMVWSSDATSFLLLNSLQPPSFVSHYFFGHAVYLKSAFYFVNSLYEQTGLLKLCNLASIPRRGLTLFSLLFCLDNGVRLNHPLYSLGL